MSAHMRRLPTSGNKEVIRCYHAGVLYQFPKKVAEKYRVDQNAVSPETVFAAINERYTKPGALLKGLRVREGLTQVQMAKRIKVTQSDISQMENGVRPIGRKIAQRIEKLFDVDYRSFLA